MRDAPSRLQYLFLLRSCVTGTVMSLLVSGLWF